MQVTNHIPAGLLNSDDVWKRVESEVGDAPSLLNQLSVEAERFAEMPPSGIVSGKKHLAPGSDPHDYVSIGTYWWPDPEKPDGLPWIRRDGLVTPSFREYDNTRMEEMYLAVSKLILHARTAGSPVHARHAGGLLRAWFLEEATRMNPHLRYAQFIPGICDGRCIGLIDTMLLLFLLDSVTRLEFNECWTPDDLAGLKRWVARYLEWLRESEMGREEESQHNNHGTWYDAQVVGFAMFCGQPELARRQVAERTVPRIARQIADDGSQPDELARTLGITYSTHNLLAYACIAAAIRREGVDLWQVEPEGRSLAKALRWMLPFYAGEKPWPYRQIKPFDAGGAVMLLHLAKEAGVSFDPSAAARLEEAPWQRIIFQRPASRQSGPADIRRNS